MHDNEQVSRFSDPQVDRVAEPDSPISPQLTDVLRSIEGEMKTLEAQIEKGEPQPPALTLRARIGAFLKLRLKRLLWWQSHQLNVLVGLDVRRGHEEVNLLDAVSQSIDRLNRELGETRHLILECKRQVQQTDNRLREHDLAQSRFQASEIERQVRSKTAHLESECAALRQQLETETAQREQIAVRVSDLGLLTHQNRATLNVQASRLSAFIEAERRHLAKPLEGDALHEIVNQEAKHKYDSLSMAFEEVFRGSRDEIKSRQNVYVPFLKEHGVGCPAMPILDLGCGRGEWLEVLRDHSLQARGVDDNEAMIARCRLANLEVAQSDALSYLTSLPDNCFGGVTSFHMVEHIPFERTLALVDEALRVLKPGGILILETPNPENILVGTHNFHMDPTHLKPLPSSMLQFFVEARGFCDVQVWRLHPYPESMRFPDDGKGIANRLSECLYGPQDYAILGRKP